MTLYERFWKAIEAKREPGGDFPSDFDVALATVRPPDGIQSEAGRDIASLVQRAPKKHPPVVVSQPLYAMRPFCFLCTVRKGELPEFHHLFENYVDKNAFIAEALIRLRAHYDLPYVLFVGDASFFLYDAGSEELLRWGTEFSNLEELFLQPVGESRSLFEEWNGIPRKSLSQRSEEFGRWLDLWKACIGARMNASPALVTTLMQKVILLFLYDFHFGLADEDMRLRTNFLEQRMSRSKRGRGGRDEAAPFDGVAWLHEASNEVRDRYRMEFLFWNDAENTFFALLSEDGRRQFSQFVLELFLLSQSKFGAQVQADVFSDPDARLKLWKYAVTENLDISRRLHADEVNVYQPIVIDLEESGVGWALLVVEQVREFWRDRVMRFERTLAERRSVQVQFDMFQQPDLERARVPTLQDLFEAAFSTSLRALYTDLAERQTLEYLIILKVFDFCRQHAMVLQPLDNIADIFVRQSQFSNTEEL
jgi:hypothetical protein